MRAFALPSVAHGYVRLNVRGRERDGVVPPLEYEAVCDELAGELRALRDARSGGPLVRDVVRTRATAMDDGPHLPDADLVVFYHPMPVDVVDSPRVGRIGPVPWSRTGGHTNAGFAIVRAPGCAPGSTLPPGHVRDLAPTMLALLGAPIPPALDGRSLLDGGVSAAAIDGAAGGPRG
jgi:predicted AlkP superfamily phosphohydrolase/phosphomutase